MNTIVKFQTKYQKATGLLRKKSSEEVDLFFKTDDADHLQRAREHICTIEELYMARRTNQKTLLDAMCDGVIQTLCN